MLVLREGLTLALAGAAIGLAGAWFAVALLDSIVYEVEPRDPMIFAAATILLIGVAALAVMAPAGRASRIDPAEAIRGD